VNKAHDALAAAMDEQKTGLLKAIVTGVASGTAAVRAILVSAYYCILLCMCPHILLCVYVSSCVCVLMLEHMYVSAYYCMLLCMCPDTGAYARQVSTLETKRAADYEQDQKDIAALQARKVAERRSPTASLSSYALK
jgi:hypothetical protein